MSTEHVQEHVDLIAKHEQEFLLMRTRTERISDSLANWVGSVTFVLLHLVLFSGWVVINHLPHTRHFDPRPYSLLGTLLALEAILLASIILMRQARMARRSDERDHLMLQILLLTEKEVTTSLDVQRQVAAKIGLHAVAENPELQALSQHTSIDDMAQTIRESIPTDEGSPRDTDEGLKL